MKIIAILPVMKIFLSLFFLLPYLQEANAQTKLKQITVRAPFDMPVISIPDFNDCERLPITDFGAVMGDKDKNTRAIAEAIQEANRIGGGVVVVPSGEWITGKVHLKSNVNLHLEKGAVLLFSEKPEDYLPAVHSTWEGMECYNYSPLVYAYQCKNIAITGEGELKAKMDIWKTWFARPAPHMQSIKRLYNLAWDRVPVEQRQMVDDTSHLRPQFIQFNRSEHVLLEGVTITNSPFWTIHPYSSKDVVIRGVKVYAHGHNNDGADPEMSQNVLIEDCVFDQGDDAIAIKSGRNPEGWRLKVPSKHIVVRNCTVKNGHQLVAIGSELSGGIEHIFVDSCRVLDGAKLNHLLFIKTNERMGGYVRNVHVSNIEAGKIDLGVMGIETDVLYQWRTLVPTYERRLTPISDIFLDNLQAGDVKFVSRILGQEELPVKNVKLANIRVRSFSDKEHIHQHVSGFLSEGISVSGAARSSLRFSGDAADTLVGCLPIDRTYAKEGMVYGFDFGTSYDKLPEYFSLKVPEGNYRVQLTLESLEEKASATIRAESRRLMLRNRPLAKGEQFQTTFVVSLKNKVIGLGREVKLKTRELGKLDWDDKLTLEFAGEGYQLRRMEIEPARDVKTVFLCGNSTVVNQDEEPWAAWGQMIPAFFSDRVAIANHAESGLSLGSFLSSNRLEKVLSVLRPEDYVFIEFGHNDQKEKGPKDGAYASYTERLNYFVDTIRKKGGIPVIVTSTQRRTFDEQGKMVNSLGDYPDAARKVSQEKQTPLIDLHEMTRILYEALGAEESKGAFVHYPANTFPNQPEDLKDNTHFNTYGAYLIAQCVVKGIRENLPALAVYLKSGLPLFELQRPMKQADWYWPDSPRLDMTKPDGN